MLNLKWAWAWKCPSPSPPFAILRFWVCKWKLQNQTKNNKFIFIKEVGCLAFSGRTDCFGFYGVKEEWEGGGYVEKFDFRCGKLLKVALDLQNNEKDVRGAAKVAGDHTPTLKSELGFLMLESLQALNNRGLRWKKLQLLRCVYWLLW